MIKANNPHLKSWIAVDAKSDFPIQNLPFGIFSSKDSKTIVNSHRAGVAIGTYVVDLAELAEMGFLKKEISEFKIDPSVFSKNFLNDFISLGRPVWRAIRERISDLLNADSAELRDNNIARD